MHYPFLNTCLARVTRERSAELTTYLSDRVAMPPIQANSEAKNIDESNVMVLGQKAKLSPEQVKSILESEQGKNIGGSKTIIPTYVPDGYKVESIQLNLCKQPESKRSHTYKIVYRKSDNTSFNITNVLACQGGAEPSELKSTPIPSKTFSNVTLRHTKFDSVTQGPRIEGEIETPAGVAFFNYKDQKFDLEEAKKILSSVEYLNEKN
jgi:hypothetical protein